VLAHKVATSLGMDGSQGGGAVSDLRTLPEPVRVAVQEAYGNATGDLFLISVPIAVLALIAIVFIKEKPLLTTSAAERRAAPRRSLTSWMHDRCLQYQPFRR